MSNEREAFEQLVRETCSTDEYTFKRDGGAYFRTTYAKTYDGLPPREIASVQTLWNFYQAGAAYQRAIAERDATIERLEAGIPRLQEHAHQMRQQRDKLAGLLREAGGWIDRTSFHGTDAVDLMQRIDAAMAEVNK